MQFRRAAPGRRVPVTCPAARPGRQGTAPSGPRPVPAPRVPTGVLAGAAVLLLVSLLVVVSYEGSSNAEPRRPATAAQLYATNCATCHGSSGQGAVGPRLAGRVVRSIPGVEDELALVTDGRDGMPSFGSTLSPGQIRRIVEYTRTHLQQ